ncbi:MAG: histidine kinase dimerization/phosphoacceptor domain-containing protein [Flammeovirgaceae bacterium]|nr:histidine kinase dimerization/phosphoacceptor domain-containing protein [Flammeovirgaceae bacterium]
MRKDWVNKNSFATDLLVALLYFCCFEVLYSYSLLTGCSETRKKMEAVRARIGRDLHDNMGSTLQSISVMKRNARTKSTSGGNQNTSVSRKIGALPVHILEK